MTACSSEKLALRPADDRSWETMHSGYGHASFARTAWGGRMGPDGLMVSVSGIRGRVGGGLTPEVVTSYAAAFGAWAIAADRSKPVVVGRDSRVSGPMFHRCVIAALQSVGARVIDLGLTTTPTCQLDRKSTRLNSSHTS